MRFITSKRKTREAETPFPLPPTPRCRRLKSAPVNRSYASLHSVFSSFFCSPLSRSCLSGRVMRRRTSVPSVRALVWKSRSTFAQPKITSNLQTGIPRSTCAEIISIGFLQYSYGAAVEEIASRSCSTLWYFFAPSWSCRGFSVSPVNI